jgi:hypothetical protein
MAVAAPVVCGLSTGDALVKKKIKFSSCNSEWSMAVAAPVVCGLSTGGVFLFQWINELAPSNSPANIGKPSEKKY